ncbi:MAG TPA: phosphotransferase [Candidatus Limnocylindrales bacterium]|nr:phosphotransferase [Candidatus Limnocylindrales bacterium]
MSAPMPTVLRRSLGSDLGVGVNRRGSVSGAGWLYALPRLEFDRIVCIGMPAPATLAGLVRAGGSVHVIVRSAPARERLARHVLNAGFESVTWSADDDGPSASDPFDLVVVSEAGVGRDAGLARRVIGRLQRDGIAFVPSDIDAGSGLARDGLTTARLALTPGRGEVRSAVPAEDDAMRRTIVRLGLAGSAIHPRLARAVRRRPAAAIARLGGRSGRVATLIGRAADGIGPAVPAYVREVAAAGGLDLAGWGWGVAARGEYDTQKVLMLLRAPDAEQASGVVKITRAEAHRARLENEGRALQRLARMPLASARVPAPWFAGQHAGRALLGESMIDGRPFTEAATWRPDDPALTDGARWLTDLAVATAVPVPAATMGAALGTLLERYERLHRPASAELDALRDRFAALGRLADPIPTVFQHGDPGIWNLLVDHDGRTVFLDWEAAEADGLPLWDLLYFLRSYAVATSRRSGVRDRLDAAARHLLDGSALSDRIVEIVAAYRDRVGVPGAAIEALIYGCWVHRSLKEASRMAPERLAEGQFVRLIRRMLARPDAPVLARLAAGRR